MSIPREELFGDDHGRPFARVLGELTSEFEDSTSVNEILKKLQAEADRYGSVRGGDVTPALRLLAFDGLITELLGNQLVAGKLHAEDFRELVEIINAKLPRQADN